MFGVSDASRSVAGLILVLVPKSGEPFFSG